MGSDALNLVGWVGVHPVVHPPLLAWALESGPDGGVGLQDLVVVVVVVGGAASALWETHGPQQDRI